MASMAMLNNQRVGSLDSSECLPATILGPDEVEINSHQLLGELPSYVFWHHLVMKIYLWWICHRSCEQ